MEKKYVVDNGKEYMTFDMMQGELGITYMEFLRLLSLTGYNCFMNHKINGETYLSREYFENSILITFNHLKEKDQLHRIQYKLPDKR